MATDKKTAKRTTISDAWLNAQLDADAKASGESSRAKLATRILSRHYLTQATDRYRAAVSGSGTTSNAS